MAEDTMENLRGKLSKTVELEIELSQAKEEITKALSSFDFIQGIKQRENLLTLRVKSDQDYRAPISETISRQGGIVLGIKVKEMSLEEAFITITQKNISLLTPLEEVTE